MIKNFRKLKSSGDLLAGVSLNSLSSKEKDITSTSGSLKDIPKSASSSKERLPMLHTLSTTSLSSPSPSKKERDSIHSSGKVSSQSSIPLSNRTFVLFRTSKADDVVESDNWTNKSKRSIGSDDLVDNGTYISPNTSSSSLVPKHSHKRGQSSTLDENTVSSLKLAPSRSNSLVQEILDSRVQIEKSLEASKEYLNKMIDQQRADVDATDAKKSLVACMKLERNFKRFFKVAEAYLNNQETDKSLSSPIGKILKRIPQVKKSCIMFTCDEHQLEQLRSSLSETSRSASTKETRVSFRRSLGDAFPELAVPTVVSPPPPPPPPKPEPEVVVTPAPSSVSQKQLLQLEVKLKSMDDKMLRKVIMSLATEGSESLEKITNKLEEAKNQKHSSPSPFKKWSSLKPKKSSTMTSSLQKDLESVLGIALNEGVTPTPLQITGRLLEGYLWVKDDSKSKKRWAVVDESNLYLFKSPQDSQQPKSIISLFCATVRLRDDKKQAMLNFSIFTSGKTFNFTTESEKDTLNWTAIIEDITSNLIHKSIGSDQKNIKNLGRSPSNQDLQSETSSPSHKELLELLKVEGNGTCADCGLQISEDPQNQWVSINLGVFICLECSGAHRNLGVHLSKVRSCQYDDMDTMQLQFLRCMGNTKANKLLESKVPPNFTKPTPTDKLQVKHDWIKQKYAELKFTTYTRDEIDKEISSAVSKPTKEPDIKAVIVPVAVPVEVPKPQEPEPPVVVVESPAKPKTLPALSTSNSSDLIRTSTSSDPNVTTSVQNPLFGKDIVLDRFKRQPDSGSTKRATERVLVRSKSTLS